MAETFGQLFDKVMPNGENAEKQLMRLLICKLCALTNLDLTFFAYATYDSSRPRFIVMTEGTRLATVKRIDFEKRRFPSTSAV